MIAWDAACNRSYEPVERRAKEIYEAFEYDGPGQKPIWRDGGNSFKQDEARVLARCELHRSNHKPNGSPPLPQPLALSDRYVVLTPEQWGRMCVARTRLSAPYVPAWSEGFGRHVIVQETLGM